MPQENKGRGLGIPTGTPRGLLPPAPAGAWIGSSPKPQTTSPKASQLSLLSLQVARDSTPLPGMSGTGPHLRAPSWSPECNTWSRQLRLRHPLLLPRQVAGRFLAGRWQRASGRDPKSSPPPLESSVPAGGQRKGGRQGLRRPFHLCGSPAVGGARRQEFGPAFVRNQRRRRRRRRPGGCPDGWLDSGRAEREEGRGAAASRDYLNAEKNHRRAPPPFSFASGSLRPASRRLLRRRGFRFLLPRSLPPSLPE